MEPEMAYRLTYSAAFESRFEVLLDEAIAAGHGLRFGAIFHRLAARLKADPFLVGEAEYPLSGGQIVHHVLEGPVNLYFTIYPAHGLVWLTRLDRCDLNE
jgi:hypothetical protein